VDVIQTLEQNVASFGDRDRQQLISRLDRLGNKEEDSQANEQLNNLKAAIVDSALNKDDFYVVVHNLNALGISEQEAIDKILEREAGPRYILYNLERFTAVDKNQVKKALINKNQIGLLVSSIGFFDTFDAETIAILEKEGAFDIIAERLKWLPDKDVVSTIQKYEQYIYSLSGRGLKELATQLCRLKDKEEQQESEQIDNLITQVVDAAISKDEFGFMVNKFLQALGVNEQDVIDKILEREKGLRYILYNSENFPSLNKDQVKDALINKHQIKLLVERIDFFDTLDADTTDMLAKEGYLPFVAANWRRFPNADINKYLYDGDNYKIILPFLTELPENTDRNYIRDKLTAAEEWRDIVNNIEQFVDIDPMIAEMAIARAEEATNKLILGDRGYDYDVAARHFNAVELILKHLDRFKDSDWVKDEIENAKLSSHYYRDREMGLPFNSYNFIRRAYEIPDNAFNAVDFKILSNKISKQLLLKHHAKFSSFDNDIVNYLLKNGDIVVLNAIVDKIEQWDSTQLLNKDSMQAITKAILSGETQQFDRIKKIYLSNSETAQAFRAAIIEQLTNLPLLNFRDGDNLYEDACPPKIPDLDLFIDLDLDNEDDDVRAAVISGALNVLTFAQPTVESLKTTRSQKIEDWHRFTNNEITDSSMQYFQLLGDLTTDEIEHLMSEENRLLSENQENRRQASTIKSRVRLFNKVIEYQKLLEMYRKERLVDERPIVKGEFAEIPYKQSEIITNAIAGESFLDGFSRLRETELKAAMLMEQDGRGQDGLEQDDYKTYYATGNYGTKKVLYMRMWADYIKRHIDPELKMYSTRNRAIKEEDSIENIVNYINGAESFNSMVFNYNDKKCVVMESDKDYAASYVWKGDLDSGELWREAFKMPKKKSRLLKEVTSLNHVTMRESDSEDNIWSGLEEHYYRNIKGAKKINGIWAVLNDYDESKLAPELILRSVEVEENKENE
jgi:hypothetical protein